MVRSTAHVRRINHAKLLSNLEFSHRFISLHFLRNLFCLRSPMNFHHNSAARKNLHPGSFYNSKSRRLHSFSTKFQLSRQKPCSKQFFSNFMHQLRITKKKYNVFRSSTNSTLKSQWKKSFERNKLWRENRERKGGFWVFKKSSMPQLFLRRIERKERASRKTCDAVKRVIFGNNKIMMMSNQN